MLSIECHCVYVIYIYMSVAFRCQWELAFSAGVAGGGVRSSVNWLWSK